MNNLAILSREELDKINVDLAAAGVAFKERHGMSVMLETVEQLQPSYLIDWFHERLAVHRLNSVKLICLRSKLKLDKN